MIPGEPIPIACNLGAMTPAQSMRYREIRARLREELKHMKELANGYAFRYAYDPALFVAAAEFVTLESLCCSFYAFRLERKRGDGSMWLWVTGPTDGKLFIRAALAPGGRKPDTTIDDSDRQRFFAEANAAYEALRNDPDAWAELEKERRELDGTLLDGLDDEE